VGVAAVLAGLMVLHPAGLRVPSWVGFLAAACFACAGVSAFARAHNRRGLSQGLVLVVLGALLVLAVWGLLSPHGVRCGLRVPGMFALSPAAACRAVAALGSLLCALLFGWAAARALRR